MFVVVSYDIVDDKRRNRVLNELKNYGNHVQYSVFECDLNKKQIENLQAELRRVIDGKEDSIRYYFLCGSCIERIEVDGKG
ncbi:MAG: CRISPR-associated endonuclease Cas2 [Acidobacteriota bacterium]